MFIIQILFSTFQQKMNFNIIKKQIFMFKFKHFNKSKKKTIKVFRIKFEISLTN